MHHELSAFKSVVMQSVVDI